MSKSKKKITFKDMIETVKAAPTKNKVMSALCLVGIILLALLMIFPEFNPFW